MLNYLQPSFLEFERSAGAEPLRGGEAPTPPCSQPICERYRRLGIEPVRLSAKITKELPAILQSNVITLREAKNYLKIYAAAIQFSSLTGFVSKMIESANEQDIRDVFQSLIAAFEFVRGE